MNASSHRLDLTTLLLLTLAPLLWAGNAIVGRIAAGWIPPMTFNLLRWSIALLVLLPLGGWVLRRSSPLWREWKYYALLGLLAIAGYNTLQYLALHTSSPLNVTLVASSMPVWMLLVGRIGFGAAVTVKALLGAALSLSGVAVVLSQGECPLALAPQGSVTLTLGAAVLVLCVVASGLGVRLALKVNPATALGG